MSSKTPVTQPCAQAGSVPATCSTLPCAKCIGCVVSATISNVQPISDDTHFGHSFDFTIVTNYSAGTGGTAYSKMEWNERTNVPVAEFNIDADTWYEMQSVYPSSDVFTPWSRRQVPCPGGGTSTITMNDTPVLKIEPGRTVTRTLELKLVAWSGDCGCANPSLTATATQVLELVNGVAGQSSFTIG